MAILFCGDDALVRFLRPCGLGLVGYLWVSLVSIQISGLFEGQGFVRPRGLAVFILVPLALCDYRALCVPSLFMSVSFSVMEGDAPRCFGFCWVGGCCGVDCSVHGRCPAILVVCRGVHTLWASTDGFCGTPVFWMRSIY
ncbi:hypothetical protein Acr_28g0003980 [Actinidia rufa]|uniref:Transmembrane protein n=1 Tax=Actinidia rufa TaxID=165716 RepID=A0A7J0H9A3_9ERIC|nr:hypothetical protein Acr_28g0003980 [Actinidia rufa]